MRDAVLETSLRRRQLVVSLELHLVVHNREERIGSPLATIGRAALRLTTAAPLIGEENLRSVVVERR